MFSKARTGTAAFLTAALFLFLIGGSFLSAFPAGHTITDEQFAEPGVVVDGKTLYLGSSYRGSDVLSDLVSAAWFNIWTCAAATVVSLLMSIPVWQLVKSNVPAAKYAGLLAVRISCAFFIFPVLMLLWITELYFQAQPLTLVVTLAFFAFPFAVQLQATLVLSDDKAQTNLYAAVAYSIRRWAAMHMLVGAIGLLFWLRRSWPGDLVALHKANSVLLMFGDWIAFLPVVIFITIALCLRLCASMLEDRWSITPIPTANSWIFLPTMLEDQLMAAKTRRQAAQGPG